MAIALNRPTVHWFIIGVCEMEWIRWLNWATDSKHTDRKEREKGLRVITYHCCDLWPVFTLNMLCVQWQNLSLLKNTCLRKIKKCSIFSLFKETGLLQGRKRNYRTIITSKCKKAGEMWVAVGGRGLVNGHSAWYSCLWDLLLVAGRFQSFLQLILAHAASCLLLPIKKAHGFLWSSLQSAVQREKLV